MSSLYSKVIPEPIMSRSYGFKKVTAVELEGIVERMQKRTYARDIYHGELYQKMPSPPRPPSSTCKRAPPAGQEFGTRYKRPASSRDINRITRRLRRPTTATLAANGEISPSYELDFPYMQTTKSSSPQERKKVMDRILRPTTASRSKLYGECVFCGDPNMADYVDIDFSDDKIVSQGELQEILNRAGAPTFASEGGVKTCKKRTPSCTRVTGLPLVSGLSRSKRVDQIVDRLYRPTQAIPIYKQPQYTTVH